MFVYYYLVNYLQIKLNTTKDTFTPFIRIKFSPFIINSQLPHIYFSSLSFNVLMLKSKHGWLAANFLPSQVWPYTDMPSNSSLGPSYLV